MMRITTLTTAYDPDEDRLRLAVADAAHQRRVLWITRRLAERLVPALLQGLSAAAVDDEPPDNAQEAAAQEQAAQAYAQLEARLARKEVQPVEVVPDMPQGLVQRIELKTADNGARVLEFHCKALAPCDLWLTPRELRQWLGLLRGAFAAAEWRQDMWPAWANGPAGA